MCHGLVIHLDFTLFPKPTHAFSPASIPKRKLGKCWDTVAMPRPPRASLPFARSRQTLTRCAVRSARRLACRSFAPSLSPRVPLSWRVSAAVQNSSA